MTEVKAKELEVPAFNEDVSRTFRSLFRAQLKTLKGDGYLREGLAAMARLLQEELSNPHISQYYSESVLHAGATENLMRAVTATIEAPGGVDYILNNARHGYNCLESWSKMRDHGDFPNSKTKCWFAVDSGGPQTVDEIIDELKHTRNRISESARVHIQHCHEEEEWRTHFLVAVTPAHFGLDTGAGYDHIVSRAKEYGLKECTSGDALQVLLNYSRREEVGTSFLFTGKSYMGSILTFVSEGDDDGFSLKSCSPRHYFPARTRFIFRKPFIVDEQQSDEA